MTDLLRRSALFVPAHVPRYVERATSAGADAVVLDLEDSVPHDRRADARAALAGAVARLRAGADVLVRVNAGAELAADLAACAAAGAPEVLLPKVSGSDDLQAFDAVARGYAPLLSVLVESTAGLTELASILAVRPLVSVALGVEDLRAELDWFAPGGPDSPVIDAAHAALILHAHAAGVVPMGILGSISEVRDLDAFQAGAAAAWRTGYRGSYCVHPGQIAVLNQQYAPGTTDLAWARAVVDGADTARQAGRGAFLVNGRMVDAPLVERARRIIGRRAAIDGRHQLIDGGRDRA